MKLEDYETRMVHDGKRNNREVKVYCIICAKGKWARWSRIKEGRGKFCSLECYGVSQRKWGKENVYMYFDKLKGRWIAKWRDRIDGRFHVQHKSKFIWERIWGKVPDGYDVHHKDEDIANDNIENLELVEGYLHKQGIHGSNRIVRDRVVFKECFKCKELYPESSFKTTYCKSCHTQYMREYRERRKK